MSTTRGDIESAIVTGAAGFIGSHVVEFLVDRGVATVAVDEVAVTMGSSRASRPVSHTMDVASHEFTDLLGSLKPDLLLHFAGSGYVPPSVSDPVYDFRRNLEATLKVLESVRQASPGTRLIFASSAAVYGEPRESPVTEHCALDPISPYGVSKLAGERYVSVFARLYGIRAASMRMFSIFGPRQRKQVVYDLIERVHKQPTRLEVLGTGSEIRDFLFVTDVPRAAWIIANAGRLCGEAYNVASGTSVSIATLVRDILDITEFAPLVAFTGAVRLGDPRDWTADIRLVRSLGFEPSVDLREGVARTVAWYRSMDAQR